jgi:hypothetical protein
MIWLIQHFSRVFDPVTAPCWAEWVLHFDQPDVFLVAAQSANASEVKWKLCHYLIVTTVNIHSS